MTDPKNHPPQKMRFGVFDSENVRVAAMTLDIVAGRLEGSGQIDLHEMVDTALADFKPNDAVDIERELLTRLGQGVAPQGLTIRRIADVDLGRKLIKPVEFSVFA